MALDVKNLLVKTEDVRKAAIDHKWELVSEEYKNLDTDMTFDDLSKAGFPDEIISTLKLLTHENGVPYLGKYIEEIKKNPIARKVKLADLSHNSDPTRLPPAEDEDEESWRQQRMEKYRKAIAYLTGE